MTKFTPQRARHASKAKPAVRQRKSKTRPSESPRPEDATFVKVDVTPEQFFQSWSREEREGLIEILIHSLDAADGDPDLEPVLGAPEVREYDGRSGSAWARGATDDREGDPGCDDREGDELEHGGDEHDGSEPDAEGEPSLGWTCAASEGKGAWGSDNDREADGSHMTEAARQRYKRFDRYGRNPDGRHVDVERGFGRTKVINLSDQQLAAIAPRIRGGEVRV